MAPLGYDNDREGRKIVINEDEAAQVRATFELYLECQSIIQTIKEIDRRGWKNKLTVTKSGKERGGRHFDKSSLFKLLTNVAYVWPEAGDWRRECCFHSGLLPTASCLLKRHGALEQRGSQDHGTDPSQRNRLAGNRQVGGLARTTHS